MYRGRRRPFHAARLARHCVWRRRAAPAGVLCPPSAAIAVVAYTPGIVARRAHTAARLALPFFFLRGVDSSLLFETVLSRHCHTRVDQGTLLNAVLPSSRTLSFQ